MTTVRALSRVPGFTTTVRTEDIADMPGIAPTPPAPEPAAKPAERKPARGARGQFVRKPEGNPS